MSEIVHKSVLLDEVIAGLDLSPGDVLLDGTFGGGGHSFEICKRLDNVKVIAIDQDKEALNRAKELFKNLKCEIHTYPGNFRDLESILANAGQKEVDGILFDLGLSSDQLETSGRGFSFLRDEPLLMTFKAHPKEKDLTAKDVVNDWSEENLATIIRGYGEERFAKRIAKSIVTTREKKLLQTTFDLVRAIEDAVPGAYKRGRIHFATKTFQAIRMAVNDELQTLDLGLKHGFEALKKGGRMAVISFHSLEDRIVKNFYKAKVKTDEAELINKKAIQASVGEKQENRRARSAKLRILKKI